MLFLNAFNFLLPLLYTVNNVFVKGVKKFHFAIRLSFFSARVTHFLDRRMKAGGSGIEHFIVYCCSEEEFPFHLSV